MIVVTLGRGVAGSAAGRVVRTADGRTAEDRTPDASFGHPGCDQAEDRLSRILEH
ncbi:hypothetical protein [Streptomyces sp. NPDC058735]|uniref:hypothetical protein n=1 Tax=unclassified Streptomyces TaxID=2593676 RepID=UPI00368770FE